MKVTYEHKATMTFIGFSAANRPTVIFAVAGGSFAALAATQSVLAAMNGILAKKTS